MAALLRRTCYQPGERLWSAQEGEAGSVPFLGGSGCCDTYGGVHSHGGIRIAGWVHRKSVKYIQHGTFR